MKRDWVLVIVVDRPIALDRVIRQALSAARPYPSGMLSPALAALGDATPAGRGTGMPSAYGTRMSRSHVATATARTDAGPGAVM
jgi:hypothetical protein